MEYDLILKSGTVHDGSGGPPYAADVAVSGDKIAAIGELSDAQAAQTLDCTGFVISPGFVDIHSHSDLSLLHNPRAESKIRQGVTTECTGQCGLGVFPVSELRQHELQQICSFIVPTAESWRWETAAEYLAVLREARPSVNVVPMVAHTPIRAEVMGFEAVEATPQQIEQMCHLAQECFDGGAVGLAFGLAYALGSAAATDEILALCRVAAQNGKHVSVHIRNEGADVISSLEEMTGIARQLDDEGHRLRLQIDHLKTSGPRNWHLAEAALEALEQAHQEGLDVAFDVYPYAVASRHLSGSFPPWMFAGGTDMLLKRLADPQIRQQYRNQLTEWEAERTEHHPLEFDFNRIMISNVQSEENQRLIGMFLSDLIDERDGDPIDVVFDLLIEERAHIDVVLHSMDESSVERNLKHPLSMVGSDGFALAPYGVLAVGRPHPRSYGTFPRFLGRYVREIGIMELPAAIHKCTARPASRLNLSDRGLLKVGYKADVTVFDPDTIIDRATYEDPHQYSEGIAHVIVNGQLTLSEGEHTDAGAGTVLRN
ncbi:MAG: D-aminoacylase [candidate division WS1 bacterium]|nr:D-aminoacylase [candidate division WS1 bacterium]